MGGLCQYLEPYLHILKPLLSDTDINFYIRRQTAEEREQERQAATKYFLSMQLQQQSTSSSSGGGNGGSGVPPPSTLGSTSTTTTTSSSPSSSPSGLQTNSVFVCLFLVSLPPHWEHICCRKLLLLAIPSPHYRRVKSSLRLFPDLCRASNFASGTTEKKRTLSVLKR